MCIKEGAFWSVILGSILVECIVIQICKIHPGLECENVKKAGGLEKEISRKVSNKQITIMVEQ